MAFGIDDVLSALGAGISLTDTVVQTIKRYKKHKKDIDIELMLEEVRVTALRRINDADDALNAFERMLLDRNIELEMNISDVINKTPFWRPFEQHRLSQIRRRFNEFSEGIYSSGDDIAALVRCKDSTYEMGEAVADTISNKRTFQADLLGARSLAETIRLLRMRLDEYKTALLSD